MSSVRRCTRTACSAPAAATLTYVYADSTAVLGPLATYAEPHCYDLCAAHSLRLTAPRGWEVVRLGPDPDAFRPGRDDLVALADAVREAAWPRPGCCADADGGTAGDDRGCDDRRGRAGAAGASGGPSGVEVGRRGHLRVLRTPEA